MSCLVCKHVKTCLLRFGGNEVLQSGRQNTEDFPMGFYNRGFLIISKVRSVVNIQKKMIGQCTVS